MSLRYQINVRILFSSLCILILGGSIAIWQARNAVNKEIDSSINLAVQLITFGFSQPSQTTFKDTDWPSKLNFLKQTRHLNIQIRQPSGQIISFARQNRQIGTGDSPPSWFINLVADKYPQAEHQITGLRGEQVTLIFEANPLDEITEVWQESVTFFLSLFLLTVLTFLAINLAFNKALKSITIIVDALKIIETGHYQQKLPDFSILEYDSIAKAINHLSSKLSAGQQENRALTQHSLAIQEDERQRLSQELHDELGQSLTAIKVMAVTAAREKADIKKTTDSIISVCDHLMTVVRSMMHQLHPLILTELGLKATLEDLLNHWSARNPELKLAIVCPDEVNKLEQKITIQVFRIVQECLTNIVRHAEAEKAIISLAIVNSSTTDRSLQLRVTDEGQGCVLEMIKTGFGLLGMRERINSLEGQLTIQTQPQQGMSITANIPLK
ncbi:Histidine kinase [Candidatus Methylobacter favarea]|uniref:histidine kinase n=1 Tax=Candidatus Methylobacter favarea TaxID=2707345 RepID=A0A8S0XE27_9GAMM|nr:histidine kinase [Candidatus Methylobacter favarea]CAA9889402.1 Histidine kinase [Candidatus Methylobacter favarea]